MPTEELFFDYARFQAMGGSQADINRFFEEMERSRRAAAQIFRLWRTVEIGNGQDLDALVREIEQVRHISSWTRKILSQIDLSSGCRTIALARVNGYELGLQGEKATRQAVYDQAYKKGLITCDPRVALQIARELPRGDRRVYVGHDPIKSATRNLQILFVGPDKEKRESLGSILGRPGYLWSLEQEWIFQIP